MSPQGLSRPWRRRCRLRPRPRKGPAGPCRPPDRSDLRCPAAQSAPWRRRCRAAPEGRQDRRRQARLDHQAAPEVPSRPEAPQARETPARRCRPARPARLEARSRRCRRGRRWGPVRLGRRRVRSGLRHPGRPAALRRHLRPSNPSRLVDHSAPEALQARSALQGPGCLEVLWVAAGAQESRRAEPAAPRPARVSARTA